MAIQALQQRESGERVFSRDCWFGGKSKRATLVAVVNDNASFRFTFQRDRVKRRGRGSSLGHSYSVSPPEFHRVENRWCLVGKESPCCVREPPIMNFQFSTPSILLARSLNSSMPRPLDSHVHSRKFSVKSVKI